MYFKSAKTSLYTSLGAELSQKWAAGMRLVTCLILGATWNWSKLPCLQRLKIISSNEGLPSGLCTFRLSPTKWLPCVTADARDLPPHWLGKNRKDGWLTLVDCVLINWQLDFWVMDCTHWAKSAVYKWKKCLAVGFCGFIVIWYFILSY